MVIEFVSWIGQVTIHICDRLGNFFLFFLKSVHICITTRPKIVKMLNQMGQVGVDSFSIIVLTGSFAGMVFALQSYIGFQRVGGEQFIGAVVALGMIRELGPVLTGLMVTGRAGSAIAAEIGTMSITEQIDALRTLRIDVFQYLVVPRIVAGTMILPFLTIFSMIFGVIGGYIVCVHVLGLSPQDYKSSIRNYVEMSDIVGGLVKAGTFGFILSLVGTYKGYYTRGGARGVGIATTQSVVLSSVLILIFNYFITKLLEHL